MTGKTIYRGEGLVKRWGDSSSALRTVTIQLQEDDPLSRHPFFGFDGRRVAVVVVELDETMGGAPTRKDGVEGGARAGFVDHSATNNAVAPPAKPGPKPALETGPVGGAARPESASAAPPKPNSTRAVMMAKDPEFWRYLRTIKRVDIHNEDDADAAIKSICGVKSKAEFNTDHDAFVTLKVLAASFNQWRQGARAL